MTVKETFNIYLEKSGFILPLNNYLDKPNLTFDEEKLIMKIHDRIAKSIDIIVQIHKIEKMDKSLKNEIRIDLLVYGLHANLFTTITSIYLCAKELFKQHSNKAKDELNFWNLKFNLSEEDKNSLDIRKQERFLFVNNSMLAPLYSLRTYGGYGEEIQFQCADLQINDMLPMPFISNGAGLIRTKYFALLSLLDLFGYLSTLGKYMCYDEFGEKFEGNREVYTINFGMKIFHEIVDEFLNLPN